MRGDRLTIKLDRDSVRRIANSAGLRDVLLDRARRVETAAKALAPVRTGAYRESIHSTTERDQRGHRARVVAEDPKATFIELGTSRTPAFAPLRRAVDQIFGPNRR